MLGIIYLILCMLTGMEMAGCLFPRQTTERGNRIWVVLPAAFGMGILMLTWAVYILSWMFSICAGAEHPLFYGNLIVFLVDILLLSGIFRWKKKKQQKNVCDIRTDDQQKMDPEKRASAFWHFDGFCDLDDVLRFSYERRHSVLRLFGIRRLCTPHGNDAIFFTGK